VMHADTSGGVGGAPKPQLTSGEPLPFLFLLLSCVFSPLLMLLLLLLLLLLVTLMADVALTARMIKATRRTKARLTWAGPTLLTPWKDISTRPTPPRRVPGCFQV